MKLAIVGSREFTDFELLAATINEFDDVCMIVSGGARGADKLAERYADNHGVDKMIFPADWDKHGKSAGFIRNKHIVDYADYVIAFWDGKSKGTKHTIDMARKQNKLLKIVYINNEIF